MPGWDQLLEGLQLLAFAGYFAFGIDTLPMGDTPMAMLSAGSCATCHQKQHAQWQGSRHAKAWTNGIFQHDYRRTPRQWCRNCHVPLAAQQMELRAGGNALASEGVNCAACHVRNGRIHSNSRGAHSPHDTVVRSDFGGAAFCGGCHQFNFPVFDRSGALQHYSAEPMQNTVVQYLASPHVNDRDCRHCHDVHSFPGSHDPAMLRKALALRYCGEAEQVTFYLSNVGAGHNVPTGDVHRHMYLKVWRATNPDGQREAFYGRRFELDPGGGKKTTWDSSIAAGQTRKYRVKLATLGGGAAEPVSYELRYVYGADEYPRVAYGEPAYRTVFRGRIELSSLDSCASATDRRSTR